MTDYFQWPLYGAVILLVFTRAWSMFVAHDILKTIFASATWKRRKRYLAHVRTLDKFYKTYVYRITNYCRGICLYLTINNIVASISSLAALTLFAITSIGVTQIAYAVRIAIALLILFIELPPIVLSFIFTRYDGGHPRYFFDLGDDAISSRARERRRRLLDKKRDGVKLTPEEFAAIKCNKIGTFCYIITSNRKKRGGDLT